MTQSIHISPQTARRLAISAQQLHNPPRKPDKENMLALIRQLGCLQIDPLNVVARTPLLVLWSRLGNYAMADFEALLWEDRQLFEYWAHARFAGAGGGLSHPSNQYADLCAGKQQVGEASAWLDGNQQSFSPIYFARISNTGAALRI